MSIDFKNSLVITDLAYFNIFYSLKEKDPFLDIKLMDKKEVVANLEFEVDDEFLKYLIFNISDLDYLNARKLARILQFANEDKFPLKKELISKGIIKKDSLQEVLFKKKKIYLFELSLDKELVNLLKRHHIEFEEISFKDLSLNEDLSFIDKTYLFKNYDDEFSFVFASINKLIIEDKVNPSDIYLFIDGDLSFFIKEYSGIYKINSNLKTKDKILSFPKVHKELERFFLNKKIDINFKIISSELSILKDTIVNFSLMDLPFSRAYLILEEILSTINIISSSTLEGINIIDKPIFKKNIHLFTLNFDANTFYKVYKNDDYLLDEDLEKIDVNPSFIKTLLNKNLMKNFLLFESHEFLGRVKEHLDDKIYDSEFIDEFKISYKEVTFNERGLYNDVSLRLKKAKVKDDYAFKKDEEYKTYDNSFKKFKPVLENRETKFSVTKFENFASCPFSYYLGSVIKIEDHSDKFAANLGTFLHSLLEHHRDPNFDYDTYFDTNLEASPLFNEKEKVAIKITLKDNFRCVIDDFYNKLYEYLDKKNVKEIKEQNVSLTLLTEESKNIVKGKIDLTLINEDNHAIIIDYKTGKTEFNPENVKYGMSMQLPAYYLLLKESNKDIKNVDGIYLSHVLYPLTGKDCREDNHISKEKYVEKFKLDGVDYFEKKEKGVETGDFRDFVKEKKKSEEIDFDELILKTEETMNEIIKKIDNFEFDIRPTAVKEPAFETSHGPCDYCKFRSICYSDRKLNILKGGNDE